MVLGTYQPNRTARVKQSCFIIYLLDLSFTKINKTITLVLYELYFASGILLPLHSLVAFQKRSQVVLTSET